MPTTATPCSFLRFWCLVLLLCGASPAWATDAIYCFGDVQVDGEDGVTRVAYQPSPTVVSLSLEGLEGGDFVSSVAVAPDGQSIVVAGSDEIGGPNFIRTYPTGGGAGTTLFTGTVDTEITEIAFSQDGSWIAFTADLDLNSAVALYILPAAGGQPPRRLSHAPMSTSQDVSAFGWAPDSRHLAFVGDVETSGIYGAWSVDGLALPATPVELLSSSMLTSGHGAEEQVEFDAFGRVYFRSDHGPGDLYRLYRCQIDGQNLEQVPGSALANGLGEAAVASFGIDDDGVSVAFSADSPTVDLFEVFTMPVTAVTATRVSSVMGAAIAGQIRGPNEYAPIRWSPDGTRVVVLGDWDPDGNPGTDNAFLPFAFPSSGPAGGTRLVASPVLGGDAWDLDFTPAGRLALRADLIVNNQYELFVVEDLDLADQAPSAVREVGVVLDGDVDGLVTSDVVIATAAPGAAAPRGLALQAVPNPFNPATRISFEITRAQQVRIEVFDLRGHQVATLARREFGPGEHAVAWRGQDASGRAVSSGAYVVRLVAEDGLGTQKVMLVR